MRRDAALEVTLEHDHNHHHPAALSSARDPGRLLWAGLGTFVFVVAELALGFYAHSSALLADGGHNLSDVLGLLAAWAAAALAYRPANSRFSYGWRGGSILAALLNGTLLLAAAATAIAVAIWQLIWPSPVDGKLVMAVAAAGIFVNAGSAWLLRGGNLRDLNVRASYLHLIGDSLISLGVVVAGLLVWWSGWTWIDAAVGLSIGLSIALSARGVLKEALALALGAAPPGLDPSKVRSWLECQGGVTGVHDLHIWSLSTTECALTAHLVMPGEPPEEGFLDKTVVALRSRFGISHSTLQIERSGKHSCSLAQGNASIPEKGGGGEAV